MEVANQHVSIGARRTPQPHRGDVRRAVLLPRQLTTHLEHTWVGGPVCMRVSARTMRVALFCAPIFAKIMLAPHAPISTAAAAVLVSSNHIRNPRPGRVQVCIVERTRRCNRMEWCIFCVHAGGVGGDAEDNAHLFVTMATSQQSAEKTIGSEEVLERCYRALARQGAIGGALGGLRTVGCSSPMANELKAPAKQSNAKQRKATPAAVPSATVPSGKPSTRATHTRWRIKVEWLESANR